MFLNAALQECDEGSVHSMRVTLRTVATTLSERMTARTIHPGPGGVPDDFDRKDLVVAVQASARDQGSSSASSVRLVELG